MDLDRLRKAAEEAAWLVARGYAPSAVSAFVAEQRALAEEDQALLACATRLRAEYAKHIARELEPEDVAKRPLKIDASSVLAAVDAAAAGRAVVQSPAGVIADPRWQRSGAEIADFEAAFTRLAEAIRTLRPSLVRWYVDEGCPFEDTLAERVAASSKPKAQLIRVPDAGRALGGAAYVASSDPAVLDDAAGWVNLVGRALAELPARLVRLED